MDKQELKQKFENMSIKFERLKCNLEDALKIYLEEEKIPYLGVYGRVKDFDSFYEKINRKSYTAPFKQTEDFIGIRVILYFPSHIEKVFEIIEKNFKVSQSEDKSNNLDVNEFGYRSHHCIITIDKDWCKTPNYSGLENIKAEIQTRTVLMHAWAEIEHKLQYKNKDQVPHTLQRSLFLLSAKLEEADQQFEYIKDSANNYHKEVLEKLRKEGRFDINLEFNLDTFREFLAFFYPNNGYHDFMTREQFDNILKSKLSYSQLVDIAVKFQPLESFLNSKVKHLSSATVFDYALDTISPLTKENVIYSQSRMKLINELIEKKASLGI